MRRGRRFRLDGAMSAFDGVVSVASPCKQPWETMRGDSRVRFCAACAKHVYSLDGLTTAEVRDLVIRKEGKVCWRFFVRTDGTVLTKDCPVGVRRVRQKLLAAVVTAAALVLSSTAAALREAGAWNLSQWLGAKSAQLAVPAPLKSPAPKGEWLSGKRVTHFGENNAY